MGVKLSSSIVCKESSSNYLIQGICHLQPSLSYVTILAWLSDLVMPLTQVQESNVYNYRPWQHRLETQKCWKNLSGVPAALFISLYH